MRFASLAADFVLVLHALFIAFVLCGQILIVIGLLARWPWVRNFWFRVLHLAAIGLVVVQAWFGIVCPLTTLENWLRRIAGEAANEGGGFIATWLHRLIFFRAEPWVFTLSYSIFGALVLLTWIFGRPAPRKAAMPQRSLTG